MQTIKKIWGGVLILLIMTSCTDGSSDDGDANYAEQASISSEDSSFTATNEGGTIRFTYEGGEVPIYVDCGADWTASSSSSWLTVDANVGTGTLIITVSASVFETERTGTVTLYTVTSKTTFATITVVQGAKPYIGISPESLSFGFEADYATVKVESNCEWEYSCGASWISITRAEDVMTVNVDENATEETRTDTITITASDGELTIEASLEVVQTSSNITPKSLILTYSFPDSGGSVTLPLYGDVDCTIDWGDGKTEAVTYSFPSHSFSKGEYNVVINGTVTALNSYSGGNQLDRESHLTAVKQWGNTGLTSMEYGFAYCQGLISLPADTEGAFENVKSFEYAFLWCSALTDISSDLFACAKKVESFDHVFDHCTGLEAVPDYLFKDCTAAKTFVYAFQETRFTSLGKGVFKGCSAAVSFDHAFFYSTHLTSIPEDLFEGCTNAEDFTYVFGQNNYLETIPAGLFKDCAKAQTFDYAFYWCQRALTEIPAGLFDGCTEATSFEGTFYWCQSLKSVPAGLFDKNLKVQCFAGTFFYCAALECESPYSLSGDTHVHLYDREEYASELGCTVPEDHYLCFLGCTKLADYDSIPEDWRSSEE